MREGTSWWSAWRGRVWVPSMVQPEPQRRPLLREHEADEEAAREDSDRGMLTYGTQNEEERRPRMEPSHISSHQEDDVWGS